MFLIMLLCFIVSVQAHDRECVRVLSCDGGAARGLPALAVLNAMENATGKSIHELFDVVGGTSAGLLTTAALTLPDPHNRLQPKISSQQLIDILFCNCADFLNKLPCSLFYVTQLFKGYCKNLSNDEIFNNALIPTIAVTTNILTGQIKLLTSYEKSEAFLTHDVMRASSTIFPLMRVCKLQAIDSKSSASCLYLIDGSFVSNSPVAHILKEAQKLYPNAKHFEVVSIGPGVIKDSIQFSNCIYLFTFMCMVFNKCVDMILNKLYNNAVNSIKPDPKISITRLNPVIQLANSCPVDIRPANLQALQKDTNLYLKANKAEFSELLQRLVGN